jgi:predicted RNA-binding protein with PIN domain
MSLVLVDGSNVARCDPWRGANPEADDPMLRTRLVDAIGSWAGANGHEVLVTFDGAGPWRPGSVQVTDRVEVLGTGRTEGDDVLASRAVQATRAGEAYWLVTSDHELRLLAGGGAERIVRADEFVLLELDADRSVVDGAASGVADAPAQTRLADTIADDDVRAKLERMRRGLDAVD